MYTILVARPGVGKGGAINPAVAILKKANTANVLSDRLTIEYVLERLSRGFTGVQTTPTGVSFGVDTSCILFLPELSVFASASPGTLPDLSDLWDAREGEFHYGTRSKGEYKIQSPCPSMLAGTAPSWLTDFIPRSGVGGGFTRRVNFVYAKEKAQDIYWPSVNGGGAKEQALVDDLRRIAQLHGVIQFEKAAMPLFEQFKKESRSDEYDDEATANYTASKWVHATKLAMCISAARGDDLLISRDDLERACIQVDMVIKDLKTVFRGVGKSDMVEACDRVLRFVDQKGYASRQDILAACWQDVSAPELDVILITLRDAGVISEDQLGTKTIYRPTPTRSHGKVVSMSGGIP